MTLRNLIFVCFSKDRPLQLDLCLRTAKKQCLDWERIKKVVIYKCSTPRYFKAYLCLKKEHPDVEFIKEEEFKTDLLYAINHYNYVFFCVDDTVFTRKFSLEEIINRLDYPTSLGFSLRLGKNTLFCFPYNAYNYMPNFIDNGSGIYEFIWTKAGLGDFSYPLELSSSVYEKEKIIDFLKKEEYKNPNELEWKLYSKLFELSVAYNRLFCYETSIAFSNPINKVQDFNPNSNRAGENSDYSPEKLLEKFESGKRINDIPFNGFVSNGCHQLVDFEFI